MHVADYLWQCIVKLAQGGHPSEHHHTPAQSQVSLPPFSSQILEQWRRLRPLKTRPVC